MRRLITMLAAGLLAAATVLTTVGVASAGATVARNDGFNLGACPVVTIRALGSSLMVGTPNVVSSGSAAILKPTINHTTVWRSCGTPLPGVRVFISINRRLALTSRSTTPGADVTLTPAGNGGTAFASQRWIRNRVASGVFQYRNLSTGLWLRVRNNGLHAYQTVTTGNSATSWVVG